MFIDLYPSMERPGISSIILLVLLGGGKLKLLILYVTDYALIIINLNNDLLLLQFYCNDK
jgi:hypothetical protein